MFTRGRFWISSEAGVSTSAVFGNTRRGCRAPGLWLAHTGQRSSGVGGRGARAARRPGSKLPEFLGAPSPLTPDQSTSKAEKDTFIKSFANSKICTEPRSNHSRRGKREDDNIRSADRCEVRTYSAACLGAMATRTAGTSDAPESLLKPRFRRTLHALPLLRAGSGGQE